ncbi:hypothetical protein, partial [Pseudomonas sp. MF6751]|uniref:hypothetical protein n=1 Tax=Pseudomonas sp. MF6751 TaxID=2797528 RepID=UPI001F482F4F
AEALSLTELNDGALFDAEFGIGHRGSTVPERSGVALSFRGRPILKLKIKAAPTETPTAIETTPLETTDYETPISAKADTGPYDDSHISFNADRKQRRSDKQRKDRKRDKHSYLDNYN